MSNVERAGIETSGEEHTLRVLGSQIYLAEWVVHFSLLWALKAASAHSARGWRGIWGPEESLSTLGSRSSTSLGSPHSYLSC